MGSFSNSLAHDAGKRPNPERPRTVVYKGERRSEKFASGVVERFVDLQGNVTEQQLIPPGAANRSAEAAELKRQHFHKQCLNDRTVVGFIEHGRCPIAHGTTRKIPQLGAEFDEIAQTTGLSLEPCAHDPKVVTVDARKIRTYSDACPHIEALIQFRRKVAAERAAARSGRQESMLDLEKKKLALAEQQAADTRKLLEKIADKVDARPRRGSE